MKMVISLFLGLSLMGCLKTRSEVKDVETKQVMAQQVTTLQRTNADTNNRIAELEEQLREMNGKVEVLENKLSKPNPDSEKHMKGMHEQMADASKKLSAYQEELVKQDATIKQLTQEIEVLKTERAKAAEEKVEKKTPLQLADDYFKQSDWKKAIIQYQKYRDENPKGKKVAESTYRIAYSFGELGMKDEAKTFYEEVISKFPASAEAKKAKAKIKGLKK
ncbi:MAG: tetratricopeptide repeat protein [Bdellovibrionaceae bacterium]|nr:tetratricopeptide repeat protein [Pseudobdellovibrionaceae bacterium]